VRRAPSRRSPVVAAAVLVLGVVVGYGSTGDAQVDPVFPTNPSAWAATCVTPGPSDLVVYGRGWGAGAVAVEVTDQGGTVVGGTPIPTAVRPDGAVLQGTVALSVPAGSSSLRLVASQGSSTVQHAITVAASCSPTISAEVTSVSCAVPGRPVGVTLTVRGVPTAQFDFVLHHVDLHGPAEAVDRTQPPRPDGDYSLSIQVLSVADRVIPVTVEARRSAPIDVRGTFAIATTRVTLPPACSQPGTTAPTTAPPPTTPPSSAATTSPTAPASTLPPFVGPRPGPGSQAASLVVSPAVGRAGDATTVTGRGFAPSATLTLVWRPGTGRWTITTGGDGTFRTQVLVLPNDIEGPRVLEVLGGGVTPVPFLVVPRSEQPAFGGVFVRG
jgi:hypothetical protein